MKQTNKPIYYFEEKDKKAFSVWCFLKGWGQKDVAKMLSYSETHLSLVLSGKRPASKQFLKGLSKLGYKAEF